MNTYKQDYQRSREQEFRLEKHLQDKYHLLTETTPDDLYFPYWDISTTATTTSNRVITFEVKYNKDYGNNTIVIENCQFVNDERVECGLTKTTANNYVFSIQGDTRFHLIKVDKLKELMYNPKNGHRKIVYDKNNFQLFIVDKDWLLNQCQVI